MWKYDTGNHSDIAPIKYKKKRAIVKIEKKNGHTLSEFDSMTKAAKELYIGQSKLKLICDMQLDPLDDFYIRYKNI